VCRTGLRFELLLPACELENFMYMGRAGKSSCNKHCLTRRLSQHQCGRPAVLPLFPTERMLRSPKVWLSTMLTQPETTRKGTTTMAKSVNRKFLLGHVGKNPESELHRAHARRQLSLATTDRRRTSGQLVRQDEWHNLVAYGPDARRSCAIM